MNLSSEQIQNIEKDITDLLKEFIDMGLPLDSAKKIAIKVVRRNIQELKLIDDVYVIGLKERIDLHRQMILLIIER